MIHVTRTIQLDEREIEESFVRSSGPGGQHVNKTSSAVQLRFDVRNSPSLPDAVRARMEKLAGHRLTLDGVVIITAEGFRSQARNRADALERLLEMIREAAKPPPPKRRPTKPSLGAKTRRMDGKTKRGAVKRMRGAPKDD